MLGERPELWIEGGACHGGSARDGQCQPRARPGILGGRSRRCGALGKDEPDFLRFDVIQDRDDSLYRLGEGGGQSNAGAVSILRLKDRSSLQTNW
jgi:hypothetical protein